MHSAFRCELGMTIYANGVGARLDILVIKWDILSLHAGNHYSRPSEAELDTGWRWARLWLRAAGDGQDMGEQTGRFGCSGLLTTWPEWSPGCRMRGQDDAGVRDGRSWTGTGMVCWTGLGWSGGPDRDGLADRTGMAWRTETRMVWRTGPGWPGEPDRDGLADRDPDGLANRTGMAWRTGPGWSGGPDRDDLADRTGMIWGRGAGAIRPAGLRSAPWWISLSRPGGRRYLNRCQPQLHTYHLTAPRPNRRAASLTSQPPSRTQMGLQPAPADGGSAEWRVNVWWEGGGGWMEYLPQKWIPIRRRWESRLTVLSQNVSVNVERADIEGCFRW